MRRILPLDQEHALFGVAPTRAIEQRAAAALPAFALMARAGTAVARLALAVAPHARKIWIAAGPGNNGGDGLEAACHLKRWGKEVTVALIGDPLALPADAAAALARARLVGVQIELTAATPATPPDLAIDALLGLGASRAPQGRIADAVRALNVLSCTVLAVDLPSGLSADTGRPIGDACVVATHTLTLLTLKPGLFTAAGRDHAGTVWLDDLGVDSTPVGATAWLSGAGADTRPAQRRHAQHKGSFGNVAVVGGAVGMSGAALLAARAAHAAGAGRVFVDLLDASAAAPGVDLLRPELMLRRDWSNSAPDVLAVSTVVCGCGGGDAVRRTLPRLLSLSARLLLDADALNALADDPALAALLRQRAERGRATVLTPHPLEAARLLGRTTTDVQADRLRAAQAIADRFHAVTVLKGSGSVIAAVGQAPRINCTGNAALATAGTGDVLAGWLGGRWAMVETDDEMAAAFANARHAVAEHGAAAEPQPPGALAAGELIERLRRG